MTEKTTPRKPAERRAFKTLSIWLPAEAAPAARAVARHGRDIQNSATFLLRTAFDSHAWDKAAGASVLKPLGLRPQGSAEAVEAFNSLIPTLNAERLEKRGEAHAPLEKLDGKTIHSARTLLDLTLFERAVKAWPDGLAADKAPAFGRLPFKLARGFATASRFGPARRGERAGLALPAGALASPARPEWIRPAQGSRGLERGPQHAPEGLPGVRLPPGALAQARGLGGGEEEAGVSAPPAPGPGSGFALKLTGEGVGASPSDRNARVSQRAISDIHLTEETEAMASPSAALDPTASAASAEQTKAP